jgi:hypothetical protein
VEGIDDLVTFEGSTVEELESAFKYIVDQHLDDCEREGNPAEKSYIGVFNVRKVSPGNFGLPGEKKFPFSIFGQLNVTGSK